MTSNPLPRRLVRLGACAAVVLGMTLAAAGGAAAGPKPPASSVAWTGNGTHDESGDLALDSLVCADSVDPTVASSAPVDGEYLLFVLASTKTLSAASISYDGGATTTPMTKSNGGKKGTSSFKAIYTSADPIDLEALLDGSDVRATYSGSGTPTLTVSHGCLDAGDSGPTCDAPPEANAAVQPTVSYDGTSESVSTTDGEWLVIPGCTNTYSYTWYYGEGDQLTETTQSVDLTSYNGYVCGVSVEVTATNESGSTTGPLSEYLDLVDELCGAGF